MSTVNLFPLTNTSDCDRGHQELQAVSAAIQTVLSTPLSVATALKGIQKTLGKALPFKVWRHFISSTWRSTLLFVFTVYLMAFSVLSNMVVQPKIRKYLKASSVSYLEII